MRGMIIRACFVSQTIDNFTVTHELDKKINSESFNEIIINTPGQMTNCPLENAPFCGPNGKCAGKYICRPDTDWLQRCQTTSFGL